MKKIVLILFLISFAFTSFSQTDTDHSTSPDTTAVAAKPVVVIKPTKKRRNPADSLKRKLLIDSLATADSIVKQDSFANLTATAVKATAPETVRIVKKAVGIKRPFDSFYVKLLDNPFFRTKAKPIYLVINDRQRTDKDEMFYLLLGLLLFLAFIKLIFSKYFQNMFRLFFQPSFRQKQTREQLQQGNLPSLLLNLFFVFSGAAYISFLLEYYKLAQLNFWLLLLYTALSLMVLYIGKFIFLSFSGWVFDVKETTESYIFATSLINKIIGVALIPFTLIIAFSKANIINASITVSILSVLLLFLYRYIISYRAVSREVKITLIHFLFYVFAFEIMPLLLIYKTLMLYFNKSL